MLDFLNSNEMKTLNDRVTRKGRKGLDGAHKKGAISILYFIAIENGNRKETEICLYAQRA